MSEPMCTCGASAAVTPTQRGRARTSGRWVTVALLLAIVAIFAFSLLAAPKPADGDEAFGGTDAAVTAMLEADGAAPWFSPIFEPDSGELESGLFALQAALGAGLLGFALGRLSGRARPHPAEGAARAGANPADAPGTSA